MTPTPPWAHSPVISHFCSSFSADSSAARFTGKALS
jgi:hypothetical protein